MSSTHTSALPAVAVSHRPAGVAADHRRIQAARPAARAARHWSVRARLYLCFLLVLSFMVLVAAAGVHEVDKIDAGLTRAMDVAAAQQRHAVNMRGSVHDRAIAARDLALLPARDPARAAQLQTTIQTLANSYALNWRQATAMPTGGPQDQGLLDRIRDSEHQALQALTRLNDARLGHSADTAAIVLDDLGPAFVGWLASINAYIDLQEARVRTDVALARDTATDFTRFIAIMTAVAMVMGLIIATLIARKLHSELGAEPHELITFAREIGQGNLKARPFAEHRAIPAGSVTDHLLGMADHLSSIVTGVRDTAQAVSQAGARIDQATAELAQRTEAQAAAVAQTATAVAQLNQTVHQNADTAREAAGRAAQAADTTVQMRGAMTQVRETMHKIDAGAKQIGEITSLIDAIAFQTNILALNASVEAARAGTHGRGFAVVATEVRNLAQRSSEAASHISTLIGENLGLVAEGAQLVNTADQHTRASMETVQEVSELIQGISQGSLEQAAGVERISEAVTQIHTITQDNGGMVRDSTAMASALRHESGQLDTDMQVFKV
ncbi:methyl-accepting chemotaxis protein [Castellaniella hirudinis]|uniref:methyl-accepting chemotaxis protein n=1 Tax=Castellaniella hirudinis TaxID=1144617 RepID=UPI0039C044C9